MVEDTSALARKLAEKEPYKSAAGPKLCWCWQLILMR